MEPLRFPSKEDRETMKRAEGILLGLLAAAIVIGVGIGVIMLGDGLLNDINI